MNILKPHSNQLYTRIRASHPLFLAVLADGLQRLPTSFKYTILHGEGSAPTEECKNNAQDLIYIIYTNYLLVCSVNIITMCNCIHQE